MFFSQWGFKRTVWSALFMLPTKISFFHEKYLQSVFTCIQTHLDKGLYENKVFPKKVKNGFFISPPSYLSFGLFGLGDFIYVF